jgi:hypothetical protein
MDTFDLDLYLLEETLGQSKASIYFVATDTKKLVSHAIRAWTHEAYNHASVAFDPSLRWCYSFNMAKDGFVLETRDTWPGETQFACYKAAVTEHGLNAAKRYIAQVRRKDFSFSYRGLAGIILNTPLPQDDALFCSEFVERVALAAGLPASVSDPALATPLTVCNRPRVTKVAEGTLASHRASLIESPDTPPIMMME